MALTLLTELLASDGCCSFYRAGRTPICGFRSQQFRTIARGTLHGVVVLCERGLLHEFARLGVSCVRRGIWRSSGCGTDIFVGALRFQ